MATSKMEAAICIGIRYSVYSKIPKALPLSTGTAPANIAGAWDKRKPDNNTAAISSATMAPKVAASGKFFQKPLRMVSMLMSSIITTNRKSTITAPRYTSTSTMAKNSALSRNHTAEACEKASMRYNTACTGLRAVTTRKAANSSTTEKR